jgi:hypothetical protein
MQMSGIAVWAFVEGPNDRAFYSQLCAANQHLRAVPHRISLILEIPRRRANGKRALICLYRYLRRRRALLSDFTGKKTLAIFFLDKDADELSRSLCRSPHVIYTEHYTVENYIIRHSNLLVALSSCASLDLESVRHRLGTNAVQWAERAAINWLEWIVFCVLVKKLSIRGIANFGANRSLFHSGPYQPVDAALKGPLLNAAQARSSMTLPEFTVAYARARRSVARLQTQGRLDKVFNGKWYLYFLEADAEAAAAGRAYNPSGLRGRLIASLLSTMDFAAPWSHQLQNTIGRLVLIL